MIVVERGSIGWKHGVWLSFDASEGSTGTTRRLSRGPPLRCVYRCVYQCEATESRWMP